MKTLAESDQMVAAIFEALRKFDSPRADKLNAIDRASQLAGVYRFTIIGSPMEKCDADFLFGTSVDGNSSKLGVLPPIPVSTASTEQVSPKSP